MGDNDKFFLIFSIAFKSGWERVATNTIVIVGRAISIERATNIYSGIQ